jgi:endonuclease YncB( thermonuclease family)
MIGLAVMVALIPFKAHASACLSIDVPPGAVVGNHDGDTFQVFSFQPGGVEKVRVRGVDTPEMSKKKGVPDEPGAQDAKEFTRAWLAKGPFRMSSCGTPTFDRIVWTVERDGKTLAQDLIAAGLGEER